MFFLFVSSVNDEAIAFTTLIFDQQSIPSWLMATPTIFSVYCSWDAYHFICPVNDSAGQVPP